LKEGDGGCSCAGRWQEAYEAGVAPLVVLEATHEAALRVTRLEDLHRNEALRCEETGYEAATTSAAARRPERRAPCVVAGSTESVCSPAKKRRPPIGLARASTSRGLEPMPKAL